LGVLGGESQFEVIVGSLVLGGLIRGPSDQPPPAPDIRMHDLSKPVTPVYPRGPLKTRANP